MKSPPTVASFPVSLDMKIPFAEPLVFSHVSLLMHTFRSQQVPTAQISPVEQSELESQPRRPPHAIFPSRQKPVPSTALPQIHVLSPSKQELNFPHDDPVQLAVLHTPFWHAPLEHWYQVSIFDEDSLSKKHTLCPHLPQFCASVWRFTHPLPASGQRSGVGGAHVCLIGVDVGQIVRPSTAVQVTVAVVVVTFNVEVLIRVADLRDEVEVSESPHDSVTNVNLMEVVDAELEELKVLERCRLVVVFLLGCWLVACLVHGKDDVELGRIRDGVIVDADILEAGMWKLLLFPCRGVTVTVLVVVCFSN